MSAIDWAIAAALVLLTFWVSKTVIPWLAHLIARPLIRRRYQRIRAPQGTRPDVRIHYGGLTYDVTDQLIDTGLNDDGDQHWVILGPQHLRMNDQSQMTVEIGYPVPHRTHVEVNIRDSDEGPARGRFWTFEELAAKFPGIEDPRRVS